MGFSRQGYGFGYHFLLQGSNLCLLHWQADSLPLNHMGSPASVVCLDGLRKNGNIPMSQNMTENKQNNAGYLETINILVEKLCTLDAQESASK